MKVATQLAGIKPEVAQESFRNMYFSEVIDAGGDDRSREIRSALWLHEIRRFRQGGRPDRFCAPDGRDRQDAGPADRHASSCPESRPPLKDMSQASLSESARLAAAESSGSSLSRKHRATEQSAVIRLVRRMALPVAILIAWELITAAGWVSSAHCHRLETVAVAWWDWIFGPRQALAWYSGRGALMSS